MLCKLLPLKILCIFSRIWCIHSFIRSIETPSRMRRAIKKVKKCSFLNRFYFFRLFFSYRIAPRQLHHSATDSSAFEFQRGVGRVSRFRRTCKTITVNRRKGTDTGQLREDLLAATAHASAKALETKDVGGEKRTESDL